MISATAYADAYFGVPGGVYRMDARRLGAGYADGAPVQYAPDLLGQGRAYQDTLAARPMYNSALRGLDFLGTQKINLPEHAKRYTISGYSIFIVYRRRSDGLGSIMLWDEGGANPRHFQIYQNSTNLRLQMGSSGMNATGGALTLDSNVVISVEVFPENMFGYVNGNLLIDLDFDPNGVGFPSSPITMGARSTDSVYLLDSAIMDAAIYYGNQQTHRQYIEAKLMRQWGIS